MTPLQEQIAAMHAQGLTDRQISDATGIATNSVTNCRNRLGLPLIPGRPGTPGILTDDEIKEDWMAGMTSAQSAQKRGRNVQSIDKRRRALGLPPAKGLRAWAMRCDMLMKRNMEEQGP